MSGVLRADTITDGIAVREGDPWNSDRTAHFLAAGSSVTYDLGAPTPIAAVWIEADGNDGYALSVSTDGANFAPLWVATSGALGGQRARFTSELSATARYVRVQPVSGDGSFAVAELQLFGRVPAKFPPLVRVRSSLPLVQRVRDQIVLGALALTMLVLLSWQRAPRLWLALLAVWPLFCVLELALLLREAGPLSAHEVSLARAALAALTLAALLRETVSGRFAAHRRI